MGTIQATEAIKLVIGVGEPLLGRLLTYDALSMRFEEFRFGRRPDCAVCGEHPTIREPADMVELCSADAMDRVRRLTPSEFWPMLPEVAIIDVREPKEFAVAHLPGAVNIPVGQMQERVSEIPTQRLAVFVCRSGARSQTASAIATGAGLTNAAHLEGGLLAWAKDVDPSFVVAPVG
jgi:adenylyltransferase/sulfurtransferase